MSELTNISALLNDPEVNLLADLFLHPFCADRSSRRYRRFRNAVILAAHSIDLRTAFVELAELESEDGERIAEDVYGFLDELPRPPDVIYNAAFARDDMIYGRPLRMPVYSDHDDIILFLGTVFLYLKYADNGSRNYSCLL